MGLPQYPAIRDGTQVFFGSNAVCRFLSSKGRRSISVADEDVMETEEFALRPLLLKMFKNKGIMSVIMPVVRCGLFI